MLLKTHNTEDVKLGNMSNQSQSPMVGPHCPIPSIGIPPSVLSELPSPMIFPPNLSDTDDAINNPLPIPPIDSSSPSTALTNLISNEVWNSRIQAIGCKKDSLSARTYQRA